MTNKMVLIDAIRVGKRRREEFGDIDGLAASIDQYGLLHSPVVDDRLNLVAGERRLRACKQLGWASIEVRTLGSLTDAERREIELEENLQRKDLLPIEQSRNVIALAETAAQVLREKPRDFSPIVGEKSRMGRPSQPDSADKIAERTGLPRQTISRARQHVEAVERYPELAPATQSDAIVVAKKFDAMPAQEREATRETVKSVQAKSEQAISDRLLSQFISPNGPTARAALIAEFHSTTKQVYTRLINGLQPEQVADILPLDDVAIARAFIENARDWLTAFEKALGRGVRLVQKESA